MIIEISPKKSDEDCCYCLIILIIIGLIVSGIYWGIYWLVQISIVTYGLIWIPGIVILILVLASAFGILKNHLVLILYGLLLMIVAWFFGATNISEGTTGSQSIFASIWLNLTVILGLNFTNFLFLDYYLYLKKSHSTNRINNILQKHFIVVIYYEIFFTYLNVELTLSKSINLYFYVILGICFLPIVIIDLFLYKYKKYIKIILIKPTERERIKEILGQKKVKKRNGKNKIEIVTSLLQTISMDYLLKDGTPAIVKGGQVITRPVYGLKIFLKSWLSERKDIVSPLEDISDFIKDFDDYIDYSNRILNFMHAKGRTPKKDETWELDIPIDEMDLIMGLLSIEIKGEVLNSLSLAEKKYYDSLSKDLIISKEPPEEFILEDLTAKFGLNFLDAKIIPKFLNEMLALENLDEEISRYLNLSELSDIELDSLNRLATKIVKARFLDEKDLNLLDLARFLGVSLLKAGEAVYFLNNISNVLKKEFSNKEINSLSKELTKALKYCHTKEKELDVNMLLFQFDSDLKTANEIIAIYSKEFKYKKDLTKREIKHLDQISNSFIKYIKEVKENPTIDDLMIDLDFTIRDANIIFSFVNNISSEPLKENFQGYSEKELLKIDDLSYEILRFEKIKQSELNLIDFAYQFNSGIYSIKRALLYISWIENEISDTYIANLSSVEKGIIEDKIKSALRYIKEHNLNLEFYTLIREIGFNLIDTHLIIALYNHILSKDVDLGSFSANKKQKIEIFAREMYKLKKNKKILNYDPEEIFTLDIAGASLDDLWEAVAFLKINVLNVLMDKSRIVKSNLGKITTKGDITLKGRHGIKVGKKEEIKLSKKKIKIYDTQVKFKTTAEKVELKRGIDFVGGLIRYKVAIKNNTEMLINNLEISLQMTAEHIRTIDIKPRVYKKGDRAKIPNMSPGQSESIDFYLEPMICGNIPVSPVVTYLDAFGKLHMATREHLMVVSKCPPIINPGEENIAKVKNIYESNDIIRSFRTFELEHDPIKTFNLLREAIGAWAGKSVSRPIYENQEPFIAEIYYYVLNQNVDPNLGHKEQIIIKIRVDEEKNIVMLNIGAEKNPTVNGVLTHIWQLANARFGETFGYEFESLHCPECGGSLDNMDKNIELVKCRYCGELFEKKALK